MLRQAVGGEIEDVPGFNSIFYEGDLHRCVAFCNERGKDLGLPLNAWATALWHSSLRRQGYERGLRREDGTVADRLIGNVVVVFEGKTVSDRYNLAQSPAIIPTLEPLSLETYRESISLQRRIAYSMRSDAGRAIATKAPILTPTSDWAFAAALDHDRDLARSHLLIDHRIVVDQVGYPAPTNLDAMSGLEKGPADPARAESSAVSKL
jgi:hypothetical protein